MTVIEFRLCDGDIEFCLCDGLSRGLGLDFMF